METKKEIHEIFFPGAQITVLELSEEFAQKIEPYKHIQGVEDAINARRDPQQDNNDDYLRGYIAPVYQTSFKNLKISFLLFMQ